jgi:hypothetical protein
VLGQCYSQIWAEAQAQTQKHALLGRAGRRQQQIAFKPVPAQAALWPARARSSALSGALEADHTLPRLRLRGPPRSALAPLQL